MLSIGYWTPITPVDPMMMSGVERTDCVCYQFCYFFGVCVASFSGGNVGVLGNNSDGSSGRGCREVFARHMNAWSCETALREDCSGCCSGFAVQDHKVVGVVFHSHVGNVDGEPLR